MKALILFILLMPTVMTAQKILLIDRDFKRPMQFTDSTTTVHLVENYFPIHLQDVNMVLDKTKWFISVIDSVNSNAIMESEIAAGNTKFLCTYAGLGNRHRQIVLSTSTGTLHTALKLISFDDSRKRSIQRLLIFADYVRNNLAGTDEVKVWK